MPPIHVLYIDDDLFSLEALRMLFERDFRVHTARSAEEGRQKLEDFPVSVILSDQLMPDQSGLDFFSSIKDHYKNVIRIIVSACGDNSIMDEALSSGLIHYFIKKPFNGKDLRDLIYDLHRTPSL